jgi:hypothetical protein
VESPVPPPIATARMPLGVGVLRVTRAFADLGLAKVGERVFTIDPSHS